MTSNVDVVFNIAEGMSGRSREAQVPSLCELRGIPYTGSDSATLSHLPRQGARQAAARGRRHARVPGARRPAARSSAPFRYPVIVKPNAEGTSKGITQKSVVRRRGAAARGRARAHRALRAAGARRGVRRRARAHGGPARRAAAARACRRWRSCSSTQSERPVYDYECKQDWQRARALRVPRQPHEGRAPRRRAGVPDAPS